MKNHPGCGMDYEIRMLQITGLLGQTCKKSVYSFVSHLCEQFNSLFYWKKLKFVGFFKRVLHFKRLLSGFRRGGT